MLAGNDLLAQLVHEPKLKIYLSVILVHLNVSPIFHTKYCVNMLLVFHNYNYHLAVECLHAPVKLQLHPCLSRLTIYVVTDQIDRLS